jgi:hypothetical protein
MTKPRPAIIARASSLLGQLAARPVGRMAIDAVEAAGGDPVREALDVVAATLEAQLTAAYEELAPDVRRKLDRIAAERGVSPVDVLLDALDSQQAPAAS